MIDEKAAGKGCKSVVYEQKPRRENKMFFQMYLIDDFLSDIIFLLYHLKYYLNA